MRYLDGFRNPGAARALVERIVSLAGALAARGRTAHIMEVCGTHTMAIARNGIRDILPPNVDLISGPGCPVCVTDAGYIDTAIALAQRGAIIATFGDMLHVPGSPAAAGGRQASASREGRGRWVDGLTPSAGTDSGRTGWPVLALAGEALVAKQAERGRIADGGPPSATLETGRSGWPALAERGQIADGGPPSATLEPGHTGWPATSGRGQTAPDTRPSPRNLAECRAQGATIEVCYGPAAALDLAARHPDREVVFLAIGFETTIGPVVSIVEHAIARGIQNISLLTAFKLVPPALAALRTDPELNIDAFLCPAHVSAIIGADAYRPFAGPGGVPCVIAGFEALDILLGLVGILEQLVNGDARVDNQYSRVVRPEGNRKAQALMSRYLEPADAVWRGVGTIPLSGLRLREEFATYDAERRHGATIAPGAEPRGCRCGDVIKGKLKPPSCPIFGTGCTPDNPVGPCMVSAEGSCAAYFKYSRLGG